MRVFLSVSGEQQRTLVRDLSARLRADRHDVFFDEQTLIGGAPFDRPIHDAIANCDLFVFVISAESIAETSYALRELQDFKERFPEPGMRFLPLNPRGMDLGGVDSYIKARSIPPPG